jgi:predicted Rossmann fold nucleotide-binding protein DprA/Smf involved in DNA uptake
MPVFSGGAAGADSFGAIGAARRGGAAAHFLPGGCPEPFGPVALFTPNPDAPAFDRVQALTRNKWVYAAAEATIVVASRFGEGGSWAGAIAAMRARLGRVIVFLSDMPSSGNEALAKLGATPLRSADELREVMGNPLQPRLVV